MKTCDGFALELRFRPTGDTSAWDGVLHAILDWAPVLFPATAMRLSDPDQREQTWSATVRSAVIVACAAGQKDAWLLASHTGPLGAITIDVRPLEVRFSLVLPRPAASPVDATLSLVARLQPIHGPATAMAFDPNDPLDSELVLQGLNGFSRLPPLFYLDERAARAAGGADHVRAAPCRPAAAPGGWLLTLRSDPWRPPDDNERLLCTAVERHLGLSPEIPLTLERRS